jgi:hypothetical protein
MCYLIPSLLDIYYIPLPNLNSDDVVMSRENLKFSLTSFCKRRGVIVFQLEALMCYLILSLLHNYTFCYQFITLMMS